ncbi:MAG: universal stress protein [Aeromonas sp.]
MPAITRILCPVDFSPLANAALDYACFMAQTHHARLTLVHVIDQLQGFDSYKILQLTAVEIAHEMEQQASTQLEALRSQLPVAADGCIRFGHAATEILAEANERQSDLIIMASHGRTGLSHFVIGSVAESVMRQAHCPVLVTRS